MLRIASATLAFVLVGLTQAQEPVRVVASVARIWVTPPPLAATVSVMLLVHTPIEFRGLEIQLTDENLSRADARSKFPIGSTFALSVPLPVVDILKKEKRQDEDVQRLLDQGIDPRRISTVVIPAQLRLPDLSNPPAPVKMP